MINPNGRQNVLKAIQHCRSLCGLSDKRRWMTLCSDGLPYNQAVSLQESIFLCTQCQKHVDTKGQSLEDHHSKQHNEKQGIQFEPVFGDVIFIPGPGHFELNMAKKYY